MAKRMVSRVALLALVGLAAGCEGIISGDEELLPLVEPPTDPLTFRALNWVAPVEEEQLPFHAIPGSGVVVRLDAATLSSSKLEIATRDGRSLVAVRQTVTQDGLDAQTWVGEFEGHPLSTLIISRRGQVASGYALLGTRSFEIETTAEGQLRMFEVNEALLPRQNNCTEEAGDLAAEGSGAEITSGDTGGAQVVDLLVVYTPDATAKFGKDGIESKIVSAVALANQAYQNSQVPITLRLAHMAEVAYTETGDSSLDLSAVRSTTDGKMDEVHELRATYGADVVSLIVVNGGGYCGRGYVMTTESTSFASSAFNVVAAGCFSNQSLTHEIGHNMGSAHDRANASGNYVRPYAFGYQRCATDGTGFRSVMAYPCSSGSAPRLAYFSNPRLSYNGYPLGIDYSVDPANSADNARSITETSDTISALRSGPATSAPSAPGSLSASAVSDTRINLSWSDTSNDEAGFRVERSSDGITFSQIASVATNVTSYADLGLSASSTYSYRVRAYNSIGPSAYTAVASATTLAPPVAPPSAPGSVSASSSAAGTASITWADLSSDEDGFEIGRQKLAKNGSWGALQIVAKVTRDASSYQDSLSGGTYRYSVRSFNLGGGSAWTGPAELVVAPLPKGKNR